MPFDAPETGSAPERRSDRRRAVPAQAAAEVSSPVVPTSRREARARQTAEIPVVQEPAAEQPFIGRRARRAGAAQAATSDAAPWRSAIADADAHRSSNPIEHHGADLVGESVVEAEPIAPAAAAELKSERLIFDEPADAGRDAAERVRAEQARAERAATERAQAERIAAEQARAEQARAEQLAAQERAERIAAEQARAEQLAAQERAERIAAEQAAQARAEQLAAQERAERIAAEQAAAEQARVERIAAEEAAAAKSRAEEVAAAQAAAERVRAEERAAQERAERTAAEQAAHARAKEEARLAQLRAERADQARAEHAAAQQRRAAQASASQASDPVFTTGPAGNDEGATDPSVDAFSAAAEAFGFSADELDETVETVTEASAADESKKQDETGAAHVAPRRRGRFGRKVAAAGASLGVMAVAGLMLVSTTLPSEAVAAAQGRDAQVVTSLTAAETTTQRKAVEKDIQAFVAPADLEDEEIARSGDFSSMSMADLAAEEGIKYSNSLYTNDTTAAIQWPFAVGVAMTWPYGMRRGKMHQGVDLVPGNGAPIQAIADGVVRKATENGGGYGVTVYIDHMIDGKVVTSHYSHMQHGSIRVHTGQQVKVGDIVGLVGNTGHSFGAHLHFELLRNGQTFDPLPWMKKNAGRHDGVGPIS